MRMVITPFECFAEAGVSIKVFMPLPDNKLLVCDCKVFRLGRGAFAKSRLAGKAGSPAILRPTSSDESRFLFVTAPSAWLQDAGYADAGWRKQDFQWVEFVLERLENTAIYLRRLSRQEARSTLA
jgi:hypothetical protein